MKTLTKALVGTVAAGAMAVSAASPASARDRYGNGGIDVGDVIAGAVIIGGIAAVAGSIGNGRGYGSGYGSGDDYRGGYNNGYSGRYDNNRYDNNRGNPREAVERCVRAAESNAVRAYRRADVTDIRSVDRTGRGYEIRGRIAVDGGNRGYGDRNYGGSYGGGNYGGNSGDRYDNGYSNRYGNGSGWNGDYRGWNENLRGYDSGSFKCKVEYGRVVDLDYSGVRGL